MKFFSNFERKYQKYAIRNLMYYITILYAVGLIVWMLDPMIYYNYLSLNVGMILHGQIWRLVTFLIYPPAFGSFSFTQIFYGLIALFLYYNLGQTLEYVWGSFRFNVFFFMGVLAQIAASFVGYLVFHQYWLLSTGFLNASLFLAFCIINPDAQFYLFFVLPVKAKWMAVAETAVYLYDFITGGIAVKVELVISMITIILFFLMTRNYRRYAPKEIKRRQEFKQQAKIVVPGKTLIEVSKILSGEADSEVRLYFTANHIVFEFDDTVVVSRLIEGEYFRIEQMLSNDYETKVRINKRELLNCIDRATLLVKEGDKKPIIINIQDEMMELKIKSEKGTMDEEIMITKEGKDLLIGFNPKFLIDALRVIDDEEVDLYFMNAKAPCFIKDEGESYVYLILPVNFSGAV